MKREDVKKQIANITDEQLDWLMNEHGKSIKAEQDKYNSLQGEYNNVSSRLKTAEDGLKGFEGVDVADLKGKITSLEKQLSDQKENFTFDSMLDGAIRDFKGMNVKAVRSLLDVDALKASKNRDADIKAALEKCKTDNPWSFETDKGSTGTARVDSGASGGTGGNGAGGTDGVTAAFLKLNPGLKL